MLLVLPKGTEIRAFVLFIHKISCIQALIYCKFMMVLSNTLEKCMYGICFACSRGSALCSV